MIGTVVVLVPQREHHIRCDLRETCGTRRRTTTAQNIQARSYKLFNMSKRGNESSSHDHMDDFRELYSDDEEDQVIDLTATDDQR